MGEKEEEPENNNLMEFDLQLEFVFDEDDKAETERLWKIELVHVKNMKEMKIDKEDTDYENEDNDDQLAKDNKRIKSVLKEYHIWGNSYFKHCNKDKIETISKWCNQLMHNGSEIKEDERTTRVRKI